MKYHNVTESELTVIGFGVIQPGAIIEDARVIENPSLKVVDSEPVAPVVDPTPSIEITPEQTNL